MTCEEQEIFYDQMNASYIIVKNTKEEEGYVEDEEDEDEDLIDEDEEPKESI